MIKEHLVDASRKFCALIESPLETPRPFLLVSSRGTKRLYVFVTFLPRLLLTCGGADNACIGNSYASTIAGRCKAGKVLKSEGMRGGISWLTIIELSVELAILVGLAI